RRRDHRRKGGQAGDPLRQAGDDVAGVITAATRAGKRADRLDNFDFEELAPEADTNVVPLGKVQE
ncbi:MAG: DNA recombination protein RmuC, partial [Litoreibacter sp.]|nr:DNA recombination protein RmuC [Litoreibacter sp.]